MIKISSSRVCLELPQSPISQPSNYSTPGAQQRSQINHQCLVAFQEWLRTEFDLVARVYPKLASLPSIWEVVTGTAITLDSWRLVLIPTLAIAVDELRVPQEWVDIPAWIADYYIAVQVDLGQQWIEVVGYSSHEQLKTRGQYDASDRTYSLNTDNLIQDINSLLISWELLTPAPPAERSTRAAVEPLSPLPQAQANHLLERLGNPAVTFPRRTVPFAQWAALLHHGGWRQQLYTRRQGFHETASVLQWIQEGVSDLAQQLGWQRREFSLAGTGIRSLQSGIVKALTIAGASYELRVFPLGPVGDRTWRIELRRATSNSTIPIGFKLRLLTEDLQTMDNNEDIAITAVDRLFIDVIVEAGESLVWEIEPTPDDYDHEILRF